MPKISPYMKNLNSIIPNCAFLLLNMEITFFGRRVLKVKKVSLELVEKELEHDDFASDCFLAFLRGGGWDI